MHITQEYVMNEKHPENRNLNLTTEGDLFGLPVLPGREAYIQEYLHRIHEVMKLAVVKHKRVTAIRFDLKFPQWMDAQDGVVITRFMESLKTKIDIDQLRRARSGKRVYSSKMFYLWTLEKSQSHKDHYHCCIFVSRDAYLNLGSFRPAEPGFARQNMAFRIIGAWASALGINWQDAIGLINFPQNRVYHLNQNSEIFVFQMACLFRRLSYFAKPESKHYGQRRRRFGSSRVEHQYKNI